MLEFLIYGSLFIFFVFMMSHWIIMVYRPMKVISHSCTLTPALCALRDVFIRDIQEAPMDLQSWKNSSQTELIWHQNRDNSDIGWVLIENTLVRMHGTYDQHTKQWTHKTKNILLHNVKTVHITRYEYNRRITGALMSIALIDNAQSYSCEATVRNRVI